MSQVFPIEDVPRFRIVTLSDGQTAVTVPFPFQANADVTVLRTTDGTQTVLAEAEDYTLSGAGDPSGGTVTLLEEGVAGETVTAFGELVLERVLSIVRGGRYDSKATDADLDRMLLGLQEARRDTGRAFKVPLGAAGPDVTPGADNHLLMWRGGQIIEGPELGDEIGGPQGKSAYEIAVDNGFVGSEAAWLASLQGHDGDDGEPGADGAGTVDTIVPGRGITVDATDPANPIVSSGRIVLTGAATYHAIDYPTANGVGGGTGSGSSGDPFVGPQYALDWLQQNLDTAGFDVRLELDADIATENGPGGFNGLVLDDYPVFGGGSLVVAFTGGSKVRCATVGSGITVNSYAYTRIENADFDGSDDDVFFIHVLAAQGLTELVNPKFGKAGTAPHCQVGGPAGLVVSGAVEIYGGAASHVEVDLQGAFASTADYTLTGTPAFDSGLLEEPGFCVGSGSAYIRFAASSFTGSATGVRYRGATGTTIISDNTLPGDADGVLDQTSSYNGAFGTGGAGAAEDVSFTPAGGLSSTDVQAALEELDSEKQAASANLDEYAAVNPTSAGLALLDDADAAAQRTTLGLGTAAVANTGTGSGNVPVLDGSGLLDTAVLPAIAITDVFTVANQTAMLALTAQKGDIAIRSDLNKSFALSTNSPSTLADWKELLTPTDAVLAVAGLTGTISAAALKTALAIAVADITDASANGRSLISAADYAAMRGLLDLEAGTDFYSKTAADAAFQVKASALTSWASVVRGAGFDTWAAAPTIGNLIAAAIVASIPYVLAQSAVASPVTGTTSETVLATIAIPANALGANGQATVETLWSYTNSANSKSLRVRYGASGAGTGGTAIGNAAVTTTGSFHDLRRIANRNATNSQVATANAAGNGGWSTAVPSVTTLAIDTTASTDIILTAQLTNTGETMTLEAYQVIVYPKA